jgi:AraC-like DNA-binding protein
MESPAVVLHNLTMAGRDEILFLHGSHRPRCIASVDKRFDYHVLQFMARGSIQVRYDGETRVLRGGWTWPCRPGWRVKFNEWPRGQPWDHRYIAFSGPLAAEWMASGLLPSRPEPVAPRELRAFARDFDRMLLAVQQPGRWGRQLARNLLENLLLQRADARSQASPAGSSTAPENEAWLAAALHALEVASGQPAPSYETLAEAAGMSLSTFRRRFRAATGLAIHQYATQRRLLHAKDRLARADLSIKQIAHETGYRDVYYFSRHFAQVFGVPPGRYRKSVQG